MNLTGKQLPSHSGILEMSKIAQHILNLLHKFFIVLHLTHIKFKLHVLKSTAVTGGDVVWNQHQLTMIEMYRKQCWSSKKKNQSWGEKPKSNCYVNHMRRPLPPLPTAAA